LKVLLRGAVKQVLVAKKCALGFRDGNRLLSTLELVATLSIDGRTFMLSHSK
jgi:hypothetical protein